MERREAGKSIFTNWAKLVERERKYIYDDEVLLLAKELDRELYNGNKLDYFLNPSQKAQLIKTDRSQFGFFHVWARGNNKFSVFYNNEDFIDFLQCCQRAAEKYRAVITGFVLMDNHFHLQLYTNNLTLFVSSLLKSHNQRYNHRKGTFGSLFSTPFGSSRLATKSALESNLLYILTNPIRAGICDSAREYTWSSFHYAFTKSNSERNALSRYLTNNNLVSESLYGSKAELEHATDDFVLNPPLSWGEKSGGESDQKVEQPSELNPQQPPVLDPQRPSVLGSQRPSERNPQRPSAQSIKQNLRQERRGGLLTPTDSEVNQFIVSSMKARRLSTPTEEAPLDELTGLILYLNRDLNASVRQIGAALKVPESEIRKIIEKY